MCVCVCFVYFYPGFLFLGDCLTTCVSLCMVVIQDGRSAIEQLQSIAAEFDKGKLDVAKNSDVKVAGQEGEGIE